MSAAAGEAPRFPRALFSHPVSVHVVAEDGTVEDVTAYVVGLADQAPPDGPFVHHQAGTLTRRPVGS